MDTFMNKITRHRKYLSPTFFPRLILATLIVFSLSSCTAIVVTSAVATAANTAVSVATLPVKAAVSLASSDEKEEKEEENKDGDD